MCAVLALSPAQFVRLCLVAPRLLRPCRGKKMGTTMGSCAVTLPASTRESRRPLAEPKRQAECPGQGWPQAIAQRRTAL